MKVSSQISISEKKTKTATWSDPIYGSIEVVVSKGGVDFRYYQKDRKFALVHLRSLEEIKFLKRVLTKLCREMPTLTDL